jgi:hypothetical protein
LSKAIPNVVQKINVSYGPQIQDDQSNIQDLQHFQEQIGLVVELVSAHRTLAQAINHAIKGIPRWNELVDTCRGPPTRND